MADELHSPVGAERLHERCLLDGLDPEPMIYVVGPDPGAGCHCQRQERCRVGATGEGHFQVDFPSIVGRPLRIRVEGATLQESGQAGLTRDRGRGIA